MTKVIFLAFFLIFAASCARRDAGVEIITGNDFLMGTFVSIAVYAPRPQDEAHIAEAFDYMRGLENLLSRNIEGSDIWRVNNAVAGESVHVSAVTLEIIERALSLGALTGGLFDITIGAVSELWDFQGFNGSPLPPDTDLIESAVNYVGYDGIGCISICVQKSAVSKAADGIRLDLGGIAKGFIADLTAEFLADRGVESALINAGGDIRFLGVRPEAGLWAVGIESIPGHILHVESGAVATSGTYQQFFYHDGILYHHILDPRTGHPAVTDIASVTVIAENAVLAEVVSTAAVIMGSGAAVDFIEKMGAGAVILLDGGEVIEVE